MTVRETLIDLLRRDGYDYLTAAEHVHKFLEEFKRSSAREITVGCRSGAVRIKKRGV